MNKKPITKEYVVNATGPVAGQRKKKGDTIELTDAQAKYEKVTLSRKGAADAKAEADAKVKAEADAKAAAKEKAEADAKSKAEADAKAKAEADKRSADKK